MSTDPQRLCRDRAKRLGLRIVVTGDTLTVWGADAAPLAAGTAEDIAAWLAVRVGPRSNGPAPTPVPAGWRQWVDLFTAEQKAARRSVGTIRTRVAHLMTIAQAFPDDTPLTITREQLIAWLGRPGIKPRSAHSMRSSARVFWGLLYDLGHRRDNPARTLPAVALPRSLPRPCPDDAVLAAYQVTEDPRLRLAVRIFVECGMRRAEVARVHTDDVEGSPCCYQLHIVGKGGHERAVPISDELAGQIREHRGYLFPGALPNQPMTARHLGKLVAQALPDGWTAHTLRHRFASRAYEATRDLRAVQELLGHVSPVTTAIYTRVPDGAMRQAAQSAAVPLPGQAVRDDE